MLKQRFVWVRMTGWWISYIRAVSHVCGAPFLEIWQNVWYPEPFHAFRSSRSAKTFNGDYRQMFSRGMASSYICDADVVAPLE